MVPLLWILTGSHLDRRWLRDLVRRPDFESGDICRAASGSVLRLESERMLARLPWWNFDLELDDIDPELVARHLVLVVSEGRW